MPKPEGQRPNEAETPDRVLASFDRENRQTGNTEQIRLTLGQFKGRPSFQARIWYFDGREGEWRPSKSGFAIRGHEIREWQDALATVADEMAEAERKPYRLDPSRPDPPPAPPASTSRPRSARQARSTFDSRDPRNDRPRQAELQRPVPVAPGGPDFDEFGSQG